MNKFSPLFFVCIELIFQLFKSTNYISLKMFLKLGKLGSFFTPV